MSVWLGSRTLRSAYSFAFSLVIFAGLGLSRATLAADPPDQIPIESFATLADMSSPALSDSGRYVAFITNIDGRIHLGIADLTGVDEFQAIQPAGDADIVSFFWKGDDYIVVNFRDTDRRGKISSALSRYVTLDRKSGKFAELVQIDRASRGLGIEKDWYDAVASSARIIDFLEDEPDKLLVSMRSWNRSSNLFEVKKINIRNGRYTLVYGGSRNIHDWTIDQQGVVRFGFGIKGSRSDKEGKKQRPIGVYLDPDTKKWVKVTDEAWFKDDEIRPNFFLEDPRFALIFKNNDEGLRAVYKFNVQTGEIIDTVLEHESVDISSFILSDDQKTAVGGTYTVDLPRQEFFDPDLKAIKAQIDRALPGGTARIVYYDWDKQLFVIKHHSDRNPGNYYLLDMKAVKMSLLGRAQGTIDPKRMARVQPLTYPARDGTNIKAYLTMPAKFSGEKPPFVILVHGGPHSRDTQDFYYKVQFLANRGYAVFQPNFRGSTGYGKKFKDAGKKQWGGLMQDDVTDGTKWLIEQGIAEPGRICIVGSSYGGYAALMGAIKEPSLYACAISTNGVSDLVEMKRADAKVFLDMRWIKNVGLEGQDDEVASPWHRAEEIIAPVLLLNAKDDSRVPFSQGKSMAKRLKALKKKVKFVPFDGSDHFLLSYDARMTVLAATEKFLDKYLK